VHLVYPLKKRYYALLLHYVEKVQAVFFSDLIISVLSLDVCLIGLHKLVVHRNWLKKKNRPQVFFSDPPLAPTHSLTKIVISPMT
jgi:hypothetical protein